MNTAPQFTDEELMAFADGELPAAAAERIRRAALNDAALSARIAAFSATGRSLGAAFAAKLAEPVPDRLLQVLQEAPAANVRPLLRPAPRFARFWPAALAAALVLAVGLSLLLPRQDKLSGTPLLAGLPNDAAGLSAALEKTPSGEPVRLTVAGRDYELLPTASLRDADGRYCREFTSSDLVAGQNASALACRSGDVTWTLELAGRAGRLATAPDAGYTPAGRDSAVAPGVMRLTAAEERRLIEQGWR